MCNFGTHAASHPVHHQTCLQSTLNVYEDECSPDTRLGAGISGSQLHPLFSNSVCTKSCFVVIWWKKASCCICPWLISFTFLLHPLQKLHEVSDPSERLLLPEYCFSFSPFSLWQQHSLSDSVGPRRRLKIGLWFVRATWADSAVKLHHRHLENQILFCHDVVSRLKAAVGLSCWLHCASVGLGLQLLLFLFRLEQGDKHSNGPVSSPTLGVDFGRIFKKIHPFHFLLPLHKAAFSPFR